MREPASPSAGDRQIGDAARPERGAEERANRRQLPRHRRLRQLARAAAGAVGAELGGVGGERAGVEAVERDVVPLEPGGQLVEVAPVGAPGGVRERLASQEAVDGGARVHHAQFRLAPSAPSSNRCLGFCFAPRDRGVEAGIVAGRGLGFLPCSCATASATSSWRAGKPMPSALRASSPRVSSRRPWTDATWSRWRHCAGPAGASASSRSRTSHS